MHVRRTCQGCVNMCISDWLSIVLHDCVSCRVVSCRIVSCRHDPMY